MALAPLFATVFARAVTDADLQQLTLDDDAIHGYARKLLAPFVLRRTKLEAVKDLLPKVIDAVRCPMPDAHREVYEDILSQFCREEREGPPR